MKKALKITGIALASLLGLVLVISGISLALIGSSGQLTKLVKNYAPQFVDCEMQLDKADLTLFKTFPIVGIEIKNVTFINPMEGSPSDTLADIGNLIVVIDAKKYMNENEIVVRKCIMEDAFVNVFIDSTGHSNLNILKEDNDSTRSSFDYLVDIEAVKLKNTTIRFKDDRNQMTAWAQGLNLDLKGKMKEKDIVSTIQLNINDLDMKQKSLQLTSKALSIGFDGHISQFDQINGRLKLGTTDISLNLEEPYLKHDTLNLDLPLQFELSNKQLHFDPAQIGLNRYLFNVNGDAEVTENGDIHLDFALNTNTLIIEDILTFLPEKVQQEISIISYAGKLTIAEAEVKGTYNDSLWPTISAKVAANDATVNIPKLPHPFSAVNLDAVLELDLNKGIGNVEVNHLSTKFNRSHLSAKGLVNDFLGDIALKLNVIGDMPMDDVNSFLPQAIRLGGNTKMKLRTDFTVKQLQASLDDYDLNRLFATADLTLNDFSFDMDTIHATAPLMNLDVTLPASAKQEGQHGAYVTLNSEQLDTKMGKKITARFSSPNITLTADHFNGNIGKMDLNSLLTFNELVFEYDTIKTKIKSSDFTFVTLPTTSDEGLKAHVTLVGEALETLLGKDYTLNAHSLKVDATINQNNAQPDFLNHWNPTANLVLDNAVAHVNGIDDNILVSNLNLLFNPRELDFRKSTFSIGQSDLSLQGNIVGIMEWLEDHKNLMKGELQLTSDFLNLNEIMDLTSGLGRSDTPKNTETPEEDLPFMVPEGVDFTFDIKAKKALFDNFDLNQLNGGLTIKDGILILQEIGFTNKAAEMLLTAMYRSPRKNNLLLAMDFHLLNVQINDLLHMLPYVDTLVPMLKTFDGQAEFHIGAETNLRSNYEPKISTLRAAADIEGKNLSVKDQFTFNNIAKKLKISTDGEYRVDSLNLQLTAFKDVIDLWPSQVAIRDYKVTVDGRMTLDKNGEYHLTVTETPVFLPNRMGLKLSGPINNLEYEFEKPKFPTLYKPNKRNDLEQMYTDLKKRIADCMKENVR